VREVDAGAFESFADKELFVRRYAHGLSIEVEWMTDCAVRSSRPCIDEF
jgi:hypothetical protein